MTESKETTTTTETPPTGQGSALFAALEAKHGLGPAPEEDAVEEAEEPVVEEDADAPEASAPQQEQPDTGTPELAEALAALRRAGTPQSVLDSLDNSDALAWGTKLAKTQAAADRLSSELGQLKAGKEPVEGERVEPVQAGQPAPFDFDAAGQPLSDNFSEDEAGAFMGIVKGATEAVHAAAMQRIDGLQEALGQLVLTDTMRQLQGEFPSLADSTGQDAARAKIDQLNLGNYQSYSDLVRDAARLAGLDNLTAQNGANRDPDLSSRKDRGTTKSNQTKVKPKAKSAAEKRHEHYVALEKKHGLG